MTVSWKVKLEILRTLNVARSIELFGLPPGPPARNPHTGEPVAKEQVVLAGLHKARVAQKPFFTSEQFLESVDWLLAHGYKLGIVRE